MKRLELKQLEQRLVQALLARGIDEAGEIAWACAWLEACGYPGLKLLGEALADPARHLVLARDAMGFDLLGISCVYLAPALLRDVRQNGRVFLRNVRHGLYLLPFAVRANLGIGCPVDSSFAVGGERTINPYAEKLALAEANGIEVDDAIFISPSPLAGEGGSRPQARDGWG